MKEMDSHDYKITHITISNCTTELLNFNFQKRTEIFMYSQLLYALIIDYLSKTVNTFLGLFLLFFGTFFNLVRFNTFPFYKHIIFINVAMKTPIKKPTITSAIVCPSTTRNFFNFVPSTLFLSSIILFSNFPCSPTEKRTFVAS